MKPNHPLLSVLYIAVVSGCARAPSTHRLIEVPTGGDPVLTTAERQHPPAIVKAPSGMVTRASFEQPINRPRSPTPLDQWSEQDAAANALGRIGAAAVPALVEALRSPDADLRLKATEVLGRMGTDAKSAVSDLTRLLDDPDERVRRAATRTLGQIGPDAQAAVPALVRTLFESPSRP